MFASPKTRRVISSDRDSSSKESYSGLSKTRGTGERGGGDAGHWLVTVPATQTAINISNGYYPRGKWTLLTSRQYLLIPDTQFNMVMHISFWDQM